MKRNFLLSFICSMILSSCFAQMSTDSVADKMLVYQLGNGGWPKQLQDKSVVNYESTLDAALLEKIKATEDKHATFDNKATSREVVYLVKAYRKTQNKNYLEAAEKGINYILSAQYLNGGWPQYYPDQSLYRSEITYNDDAMINVLNILQDIATKRNDFEVVNPSFIPRAQKAVVKGLDCILKTQVKQKGQLGIWAAQYDKESMEPAKARAFEPASLSTGESVGIVRFLMRLPNPSAEVKTAITAACNWFNANKIVGYRFERTTDPQTKKKDAALIKDAGSLVWARFYDINTNQPIFGDRDNSIKSKLEELSPERRNGYAWYGSFATKLLEKEYPQWLSSNVK